ncbi:hypothetical protein EDD15DRAFT_2531072 [Pisolithus albus]|nr:hypothetical protein EDD15DRAFT_2531072 [Pisolithus albus]
MSTAMVFGFFALANGDRVKTFKAGSSTATYHCIYETTIQCTSGALFPAMLRVYSPYNDVALPDNTIAFVSAKVGIPTSTPGDPVLLEGICVVAVLGDPNSDAYEHALPDFPYPMVVGLGSVTSPPRTLPNGTSKAFDVVSTDYVRDTRMTSTVTCVFDSARPRWSKTPLPNQNTVVFYVGHFSDAASTGGLQVELESISLNVGMAESRSAAVSTPSSPSKKRKFTAVVPKEGSRRQTVPDVGDAGEKPPLSPTASLPTDPASSTTATHLSPRSRSCSVTPTDESPAKGVLPSSTTRGKGKSKRS